MIEIFSANQNAVAEIVAYTEKEFTSHRINAKLTGEYRLLVEELATRLVEKAKPDASITVKIYRHLGSIHIAFDCPGNVVILEPEDEQDFGGRILADFSNYLSQYYSSGVNHIVFSTDMANRAMLYNIMAVAGAVLSIIVINLLCSVEQIDYLKEEILSPIIVLFTRCIRMMATPVAFFSLAAFIVNIQLTLNRNTRIARLVVRYAMTSVLAILIGIFSWLLLKNLIPIAGIISRTGTDNFMGDSFVSVLLNLIGNNIIEPFMLTNPAPMLTLSMLTGFTAGSLFGRNGIKVRDAIEACNDFFCRMINLAYSAIHIFLYIALLYLCLNQMMHMFLKQVLLMIPLLGFPLLVMLSVYAVQLRMSGVRLKSFLKEYGVVLLENLKIGSNVESLPYNRRMLSRITKVQRNYLNDALKLGAAMNMDGNCVMISAGIMWQITMADISLSPAQIIGISVTLILISVGAPNQPGSFMICMSILMGYVGVSTEMFGAILVTDAFMGKLYSAINSIGDISTVVSEWNRLKKKQEESGIS